MRTAQVSSGPLPFPSESVPGRSSRRSPHVIFQPRRMLRAAATSGEEEEEEEEEEEKGRTPRRKTRKRPAWASAKLSARLSKIQRKMRTRTGNSGGGGGGHNHPPLSVTTSSNSSGSGSSSRSESRSSEVSSASVVAFRSVIREMEALPIMVVVQHFSPFLPYPNPKNKIPIYCQGSFW